MLFQISFKGYVIPRVILNLYSIQYLFLVRTITPVNNTTSEHRVL